MLSYDVLMGAFLSEFVHLEKPFPLELLKRAVVES